MPYTFSPARTLCIIDKSSEGPVLEPYYAEGSRTISESMSNFDTSQDIREVFGSGNLVDAFFEATKIGVDNLHLIRIDPNTDLDEYKQIEEAYEICDSLKVDIIIPATINIDDIVFGYDDFKLVKQRFTLEEKTDSIKLNYPPKKIETFKINEEIIYNYSIEGEDIKLPYKVKEGSYISTKYYIYDEMEISFRIIARKNNKIIEKVELENTFNPEEDEYITEDEAIEYFDRTIDDDIDFYINHDLPYLDLYVDRDGKSRVYANIKDKEYIESTIEKIDIYDNISKMSRDIGAISIIRPPREEDYIDFAEDIKERDEEGLKYIMCPVTEGTGAYTENISVIIGCNMAIRQSNISLTNKDLSGLETFSNEHLDSDKDDYIDAGYIYIDSTVRNGNVILKAQTFDEGVFNSLKVIRTALDFKRNIDRRIMYHIIGKPKTMYSKLRKIYIDTLEEFMEEGKIIDYSIDFQSRELTDLSITIRNEVNLIENSIISEDMRYV